MRLVIIVAIALAGGEAYAQVVFPPDPLWIPMACDGVPMFDPVGDDPAALGERDVVGGSSEPAGLRAADAVLLYLRIRVEQDPEPGGVLAPLSWGMAFDLDGDVTDYEVLAIVDGTVDPPIVALYENRTVTTPNDPREPADLPAIATYPFADNARTVGAGSAFGGDGDFFIDFAVEWADLIPLGFDHDTPVFVWVASSDNPVALTGDFACHDATGGAPVLDDIVTDQTVADPTIDSDGDGFTDAEEVEAGSDPNDPNSIPVSRLEGGGGCSTGVGAGLAAALAVFALRRKRRAV